MNNLEYPKEPQFCPKNEINIGINVDTEELDSAITKAKELVALLREANELQSSLSGSQYKGLSQIITDDTPELIGKSVETAIIKAAESTCDTQQEF